MKAILILAITFAAINVFANASLEPEIFPAAPSNVYVPQGFDTNDNVEIFFEGEFMNSCYKVGMTVHTVDEETKSIYITDLAHYFGEGFCAAVVVPYQKGLNAGLLNKGEYKIFFRHSRGNFVESQYVPVKPAQTDQADDHLYAPVKYAQYIPGKNQSPGHLKLMGTFKNSCMRLDYVKVNIRPYSNVVDVLPVAIMDRGGCKEIEGRPFEHNVELNDLHEGRFLLHVRALNGQSVNEIVTVR